MRFIFITLTTLLLSLGTPILAQDYEKGLAAYNAGDYATALKEWKPLAEQGISIAQTNLGVMYNNGLGVPQDDKEAVKWFKLAAEQGNAQAQTNLGVRYYTGQGVLADFVRAHMWFNIASANGHENGAKGRDMAAQEMTPEDISKAQAMARECMSSNYQNCGD